MGVFIDPTAVVDDGATIGDGTKIWHFVHVMAGARIGRDCVLGQGCFVASGVVVGDGCRIQNNVSLYEGVELADDVFLGPSSVFTNVKHPRAAISRRDAFMPTRVGKGASVGANATIVCGVSIGAYAMVGAGAVVTHDVQPYAVVVGNPAMFSHWACRCGERLGTDANAMCAHCGVRSDVTRQ